MTRLPAPTYRVIRSIEHRGVAEVNVCYHTVFGEEVVCKRFDTLGLEDSIAYQEPQLLHGITHPNVVQIFDARLEQQGGIPLVEIYMPYYREGSINDALMADDAFSHRQAVELTRDVLSALTYLHEQMGYLHRDVKPANILLTDNGRRALLTDFGSAAVMDERGLARGSLGRSPLYEPPEASHGDSGVPGDVYAVGLCLLEMLNGRFPYEYLDYMQVTERLREGRRALPDRMYEHGFWVPQRLRRIVNKAIARRPEERYQTASTFRAALLDAPLVDWRCVQSAGTSGIWEGEWIGRRGRDQYRIDVTVRRGSVRATAKRQSGAGAWRQFGVGPIIGQEEDTRPLAGLFEAVRQYAAQRLPV
jgi:eukaryotic-like serine/threonine-protein kinase